MAEQKIFHNLETEILIDKKEVSFSMFEIYTNEFNKSSGSLSLLVLDKNPCSEFLGKEAELEILSSFEDNTFTLYKAKVKFATAESFGIGSDDIVLHQSLNFDVLERYNV